MEQDSFFFSFDEYQLASMDLSPAVRLPIPCHLAIHIYIHTYTQAVHLSHVTARREEWKPLSNGKLDPEDFSTRSKCNHHCGSDLVLCLHCGRSDRI